MRICLASEHFSPHVGGIERHVEELGQQLTTLGHDVCVVTTTPGPPEVAGLRVRRFRVPLLPVVEIPFTPLGILKLGDFLREEAFELVHCHHSVVSPAVACVAYQSQRMGIPTVATFHSLLDGYTPAFRLLDRFSGWSRWPLVLSAVSPAVAEGICPVLPNREVLILPNGFDPEFWRTPGGNDPCGPEFGRTPGRNDPCGPEFGRTPGRNPAFGEVVIVSTLRLAPRKRPMALVKMVALLRESLPQEFPLRVRLIGDGPERRKVERAMEALGLGDRMELTGELDPDSIREAYGGAHIFAMPSVEESFGLAALEALAAGLPVVARRGPGVAQFVTDGENGFLADSDGEMVTHLHRLLTDPDLRNRLARADRATFPNLSWPQVMETHLAAYEKAQDLLSLEEEPR